MNISAINNQTFQGKEKQYGVKIIGELGEAANNLYKKSAEEVGILVKDHKRELKLLERNNALYANSGSITSISNVSDLGDSSKRFFKFISGNIKANEIAEEKSLKKGLEYLA